MTRLLKILFFVISFVSFIQADEIIPRFGSGVVISYSRPDAKIWKIDASQEEEQRGLILYKRETIIDDNGVRVEPVLSIIYRKTPAGVENLLEFAAYSKATLPYEVMPAFYEERPLSLASLISPSFAWLSPVSQYET
jgi:hypothetical protein